MLTLAGSLLAGESTSTYPLWDGEPVADYAKRVDLPATQTLDLGNGIKLELALIPVGKFIMGTPDVMSCGFLSNYRHSAAFRTACL